MEVQARVAPEKLYYALQSACINKGMLGGINMTNEEYKAYIAEYLNYNRETGELTWKKSPGGAVVGSYAGSYRSGYLLCSLNYESISIHRIIWFIEYGEWPELNLDHINGIKDDNRIENLRLANKSQNGANRGKNINNTSGYKGVTWSKVGNKWAASIWKDYERYHLGYFDEVEEAAAAYEKAATALHGRYAYRGEQGGIT